MMLVIHFNAFTKKLEGGYRMADGRKIGGYLRRAEIVAVLAAEPEIKCLCEYV